MVEVVCIWKGRSIQASGGKGWCVEDCHVMSHSSAFLPLVLEQGLSNLKLTDHPGRLASECEGSRAPIPTLPHLSGLGSQDWAALPSAYMGSEDLTSSPCVSMLSTEAVSPALGNAFHRARAPHCCPSPTPAVSPLPQSSKRGSDCTEPITCSVV